MDNKLRKIVESIVTSNIPITSFTDELLLIFSNHVEQIDERTWKCDSGWTAAAFLVSYKMGQNHPLHETTNGQPLLFRGQANSEWQLQPFLFREGINQEWVGKATKAFIQVVGQWFKHFGEDFGRNLISYKIANNPNVIRAIAQHYDIPTSLLDWTTSPMVALNFATTSKHFGKSACVFALPLSDAFQFPLSIIIPPPIVERIYLQKGVFIDLTEELAKKIEKITIRVLFPPESEIPPIGSEARNYDGLLKKSNWFEAYADKVKELEEKGVDKYTEKDIYDRLLLTTKVKFEEDFSMIVNEFYFATSILDFTESLGLYSQQIGNQIKKKIAKKLKEDNPLLFDALADSYNDTHSAGKDIDSRIEELLILSNDNL
jgi:hypothetical protein